jgi:Protein of unknown function (DUF3179)
MKQRTLWLTLAALCLIAFACFAFPMYVIRPFRAQGARELSLALIVRAWGPWLAPLSAIASLSLVILFWKQRTRVWGRLGAVVVFLLTAGFAALSRVNVYELMFHPVPSPGFVEADKAHVDSDDMVLAVSLASEPRAYPIRTMGYHHIVNDWVGGQPIVATY